MNIFRFFVASKLLDATKTSTAQHLTGIKCHFYLLNNFLYAIQTHYEKERNVVVFRHKIKFFCKTLLFKKPHTKYAELSIFGAFSC